MLSRSKTREKAYNHRVATDFHIRSDREALDDAVVVDEDINTDLEREEDQISVERESRVLEGK